jgi:hypothetical protein
MCEGHPHCTRHPVYRVTIHRVDRCNKPPAADSVYLVCPTCINTLAQRIAALVSEIRTCWTCKRSVHQLHDIFSVEYLRETA